MGLKWRARRVGAGVIVAALVAAGCGDDGDGSASASDGENVRWDGREPTPMDVFMGWDEEWDPDDEADSFREDQQRIEELTADCMREEGFEYIPYVGDFGNTVVVGADEDDGDSPWALEREDPEEFARTYGYGTSTIDFDHDWDADGLEEMLEADPNHAITKDMSDSELDAYETALWGDWPDGEAELELLEGDLDDESFPSFEAPDPEDRGCYDTAMTEVYGEDVWETSDGDAWAVLDEAWDAIERQIEDDPAFAAAREEFINCMADAGHTGLEDVWGGHELVWERYNELAGFDEGDGFFADDRVVIAEADIASGEDSDDGDASGDDGDSGADDVTGRDDPLADADPDDLAEMREYEIEVAVADYECREKSDYDDIEHEVRVRVEEEYIEANRDALEAARDAMDLEGVAG